LSWQKAFTGDFKGKKHWPKYLGVDSKGYEILPYSKHKEIFVVVLFRGYTSDDLVTFDGKNNIKHPCKIYFYVFSNEADYKTFCSGVSFLV
jgi:hypothetical protein